MSGLGLGGEIGRGVGGGWGVMEGVWNHRGGVRGDLESELGYLSSFGRVISVHLSLQVRKVAVHFRDGIATCMYKLIDYS